MSKRKILIIGGGVIGLSIAESLSRRGILATVLEKGDFGREASWAGAGYLSLRSPVLAGGPIFDLAFLSTRMYPQWIGLIQQESGVDPEYRTGGALEVCFAGADEGRLKELHDRMRDAELPVEWISGDEARRLEAEISPEVSAAVRMPETSQVRPPRLIRALLGALTKRGVELKDQTAVSSFILEGRRVKGVKTSHEEIEADVVVLAGGAWSGQLAERLGLSLPVKPIRGQVLMFATEQPVLREVLFTGSAYLVPRADGHLYVGSTIEDVGFNKNTTLQGVGDLETAAFKAVPGLRLERMEARWAGLRPGTPDGRPFLGFAPGYEGLVLACGHYAHGFLLAPATGLLLDQLLRGEETDIPLEPFASDRKPLAPLDL